MANLIPVAIWLRVSDDAQAEKFGLQAQLVLCEKVCAQYGLRAMRTFRVVDVSGKDIMLAPETHELIAMMMAGTIKGVVAAAQDRICRAKDLSAIAVLAQLQQTNTTLYLPTGVLDTRDKMGAFMSLLLAAIGGLEISTIKERTMRGKEEARKAGKWCGGPLPYGVSYEKEVFSYNEKAKNVRDAFERVLAGEMNWETMSARIGVSSPGLRHMLRHPIYTGYLVHEHEIIPGPAKKHGKQGRGKRVKRDPSRVVRVKVIEKPLVSQEMFNAVQRSMNMKAEASRRACAPGFAKYNGFLFCSICGSAMTPWRKNKKGGGEYYYCLNRRSGRRKKGCVQPYSNLVKLEAALS